MLSYAVRYLKVGPKRNHHYLLLVLVVYLGAQSFTGTHCPTVVQTQNKKVILTPKSLQPKYKVRQDTETDGGAQGNTETILISMTGIAFSASAITGYNLLFLTMCMHTYQEFRY